MIKCTWQLDFATLNNWNYMHFPIIVVYKNVQLEMAFGTRLTVKWFISQEMKNFKVIKTERWSCVWISCRSEKYTERKKSFFSLPQTVASSFGKNTTKNALLSTSSILIIDKFSEWQKISYLFECREPSSSDYITVR